MIIQRINLWIEPKSVLKGILAMKRDRGKVNYSIDFKWRGFWFHVWTPVWHKGRGPYITIGLWFVRIVRGY